MHKRSNQHDYYYCIKSWVRLSHFSPLALVTAQHTIGQVVFTSQLNRSFYHWPWLWTLYWLIESSYCDMQPRETSCSRRELLLWYATQGKQAVAGEMLKYFDSSTQLWRLCNTKYEHGKIPSAHWDLRIVRFVVVHTIFEHMSACWVIKA